MASKIRVLSDHTINKIAAGEVIENPASVVKELVENSLDAGASEIRIEIQGGGRQLIRISDNGCGMSSDDALLCLERHATSKLRNVEEIHSLSTMGFRGEAIPSIASISKFNLLTCAPLEDNPNGTMVIVDGGKIISCHPAARSQGTTIEVKSLFFNVPVRKKFLKSPTIDANEILKMVSLIAMGHPAVKFQLFIDGKNSMTAPTSRETEFSVQLKERIESVLGAEFINNCTAIDGTKEGIVLKGLIGQPGYTRHNRTGQYLFINKRGVVSPIVAYAVKDGLGTSIPTGRFPVFVLHLELPGDLVDVNVHPQKREVRLRQEQLIKELIIKAVRSGISQNHAPAMQHTSIFTEPFFTKPSACFEEVPETWTFKARPAYHPEIKPIPASYSKVDSPEIYQHRVQALPFSQTTRKIEPPKAAATFQGFIILDGTTGQSFIEKGGSNLIKGGLILIDQRNAHGRILFEKLTKKQAGIAQQTLLIPHTIELPPHESSSLRDAIPILNKMGIQIREFGKNAFLIDSIPQLFGNSNLDILMEDILHDLRTMQVNETSEQIVQNEQAKLIVRAATKAAVSTQRRLTLVEAQSLIDQLIECEQPYHCPSGKPVMAQITSDALDKLFQR